MRTSSVLVEATFFARPVEVVARDMIGRWLSVNGPDGARRALVLETEAYGGPDDPASHAAFKPNGRASAMWASPGTIYVYAAYGMYPCLNFVTGDEGSPSAVLLRGILVDGHSGPTWGPGRTTRALGVTVEDHGLSWHAGRFSLSESRLSLRILNTPRVGISRGTDTKWRFLADESDIPDWTSS